MADLLESLVSETLAGLGYELVEFRRAGTTQRPILQIRIDLPGTSGEAGVSSDDCVRASRALEQPLDERGLVGAQYTLEISSPGLDRPLRHAADWRRFTGERVKLRHQALQGTVLGFIEGVDEISANRVLIRVRREDLGETMELDLSQMREARLAPDLGPKPKPGGAAAGRSGGPTKKAGKADKAGRADAE